MRARAISAFAFVCVFALSSSMLTGCAVKPMVTAIATHEGLASYYSYEFQGRPTSSGEIFDTEKLTGTLEAEKVISLFTVKNLADMVASRAAAAG